MSLLSILKIPDKNVQIMVALVVWWEEYADAPVTERCDLFDPFLNHPDRLEASKVVTRYQIYEGLVSIGWSRYKAMRRLAIKTPQLTLVPDETIKIGTPDPAGGITSEMGMPGGESDNESEQQDARLDY